MYFRKLVFALSLALFVFFFMAEVIASPTFANHSKITSSSYQFPLLKEYTLNIDGKEIKAPLFINESERTMISATELTHIFPCTIDWNDSNQIYISKDDKYWCFTNNDLRYFSATEINTMDTAPMLIDNDMYIPLRYIVQEFGYYITFCPSHRIYFLSTNPNYITELDCEKMEINEPELTIPNKLPLWGSLEETSVFSPLYTDEKLICGYYTTLIDSSPERTNNIKIASQVIDNLIIPPGKVFSFNQIVGQRTTEKGYREAPIFAGKQVVPGVGGGICQITSTLYNTALLGNFPIIERYPHSLKVAYVAPNFDASVAWPTIDFKFQNHHDFPVKIIAKVVGNYLVTGIVDVRNDDDIETTTKE